MKSIGGFGFSIAVTLFACFAGMAASAQQKNLLQPGQASGVLVAKEKTINLSHAATFIDAGEKGKPLVLLLTDQTVPTSSWKGSSDMTMYRMGQAQRFGGVAFWLDEKRKIIRSEFYAGSFPTGALGIFELKVESETAKSLSGSAHSTDAAAKLEEPVKLDVRFNTPIP